ncbi:MAG: dTMP kinase [Candidatus Atribacteria bacterium]|nr:dTMP kinase [Candidatus Atribacteria bacterium]
MLITFEGIDGAGKSTLAKILANNLEQKNYNVVLTKEPGGTPLGEYIRKILLDQEMDALSEFLLFASDRHTHVKEVIVPALNKGAIVISDRYHDSSVAYQGYGRNLSLEFIEFVHNKVLEGIMPELTILVDIPVNIGFGRLKTKDRIEKLGEDYLEKVRYGYLTLASEEKRFFVVNGTKSIDELSNQILTKVMEMIK